MLPTTTLSTSDWMDAVMSSLGNESNFQVVIVGTHVGVFINLLKDIIAIYRELHGGEERTLWRSFIDWGRRENLVVELL